MLFLQVVGGALMIVGLIFMIWKRVSDPVPLPRIVIPASVAVFLTGAIMFGYPFYKGEVPAIAPPTTGALVTSPVGHPRTTAAAMPAVFQILAPTDGASVGSKEGVVVSGTAAATDGDLWVFVISGGYQGGQVYYLMTNNPVPVTDDRWSVNVSPIGAGAEDVGQTFTIVVALAEDRCSAEIAKLAPNAQGDITLRVLPPGCHEAGRIHVVLLQP